MPPAIGACATAAAAAELMNALPHIDSLDDQATVAFEHHVKGLPISDEYGYCLPHKHFDFASGEVMVFEFEPATGKISAKVDKYSADLMPVVMYPAPDGGNYVPVAFCKDQQFKITTPPKQVLHGNVGVCSTAFAAVPEAMLETTDEVQRTQRFVRMPPVPAPGSREVVTMVFPHIQHGCSKWCHKDCNTAHHSHHDKE